MDLDEDHVEGKPRVVPGAKPEPGMLGEISIPVDGQQHIMAGISAGMYNPYIFFDCVYSGLPRPHRLPLHRARFPHSFCTL